MTYGDEEYGKYVRLNKRQVNKLIRYMSKNNEYSRYSNMIAELNTLKENNKAIYVNADW